MTIFVCRSCYDGGLGAFELVRTVVETDDDGTPRLTSFDCPNCGQQGGFFYRGDEGTIDVHKVTA